MFLDKVEVLPGFWIIQQEIIKALSEKPFFYNDLDTGLPVYCPEVSFEVFNHYFQLWEDFHYFGLPGGAGSEKEPRWLLDFLKKAQRAYTDCELFVQHREGKA